MGRMVDADEMIELVNNHINKIADEDIKAVYESFIDFINRQPTAYDVEKVVAELEALEDTNTREVYLTKHICLDDAIDIVKRGGAE